MGLFAGEFQFLSLLILLNFSMSSIDAIALLSAHVKMTLTVHRRQRYSLNARAHQASLHLISATRLWTAIVVVRLGIRSRSLAKQLLFL